MVSWSYGCPGNRDIKAEIVMHENPNSRGPVAWRPELGEVMGHTAKSLVNRGLIGGAEGLFPPLILMCCTPVLIPEKTLVHHAYNLSITAFIHLMYK